MYRVDDWVSGAGVSSGGGDRRTACSVHRVVGESRRGTPYLLDTSLSPIDNFPLRSIRVLTGVPPLILLFYWVFYWMMGGFGERKSTLG